jgi:hypothetical protein
MMQGYVPPKPSPESSRNVQKRRRGRPATEDYAPFSRFLLFQLADLRNQPLERPWPESKESDPGRGGGVFDEVQRSCRALSAFRPASAKSFEKWWDCALELILALAGGPDPEQLARRSKAIGNAIRSGPFDPLSKRILPIPSKALKKRLLSRNPRVADAALVEFSRHRVFQSIPEKTDGPNRVADFLANRAAFKTTRGRIIEQRRRKLQAITGGPVSTVAVELSVPQIEELVSSISDSQRRAALKKTCRKEWPRHWSVVLEDLGEG